MHKGIILSGEFGSILVREKSDAKIELGELLIAESGENEESKESKKSENSNSHSKILLQVFALIYGSQLSQQNLELISGLKLEENTDLNLMDESLRNYILAKVKNILLIKDRSAIACKLLPKFFSDVREIHKEDRSFLTTPKNPFLIGNLRSGSSIIDFPIYVNGEDVLSHHILVSGTTGRGKSNLMYNLLWNLVDKDYCGLLVLDPHDEYFGRNSLGLKDHELALQKVVYYTSRNVPPGCRTLKINLKLLHPHHFSGVIDWSDAQYQALYAYNREYGDSWIEACLLEKPLENVKFNDATIAVVKRRLVQLLQISISNNELLCKGIFDLSAGQTTIHDIVKDLTNAKTVIIDTSNFAGSLELLVGSLIANEILHEYKNIPSSELKSLPVISIVLEEAPRVLGKDILEKGSNIFSTIAREGRKFRIGLTAITQLPSLIPKDILANMNTKIILGTEMKQERQAIIESSAQDLSNDDRTIASLDKGEALVSSTFVKFATPLKIPLFSETVKSKSIKAQNSFNGMV